MSHFGTTTLPYLGDFAGSSQTPLSGCYSHKPRHILTNTLRIRLVSIYDNGAGHVRVHHMSLYNICELDAPSPRFAGLMRSCVTNVGLSIGHVCSTTLLLISAILCRADI